MNMETNLLNLKTITMDWSLESFLVNLIDKLKLWGSGLIMLLGVCMMIVAVWQIGKGFMSQRSQTNWPMSIGCLLIGGMLLSGGYNLVANISKGAGTSIEAIGTEEKKGELKKSGENGKDAEAQTETETIILPFGNISAHINMK